MNAAPRPRRVLVVEDDAESSAPLAELLEQRGYEPLIAGTLAHAAQALDAAPPDLILLDMGLPDGDGMDLLTRVAARPGRHFVVVLTSDRKLERAVEAMRLGAVDYVTKPLHPGALEAMLTRVGRLLDDADERRALRRELARHGTFEGLVGRSRAMREVYELADRGAPSRLPIFIGGESGTGKELLARAIHRLSPRRGRPFVALNCGAIPSGLAESELFGHERGAFTGAAARREGAFEQANGGTLLLDELGEMPLDLQVRLLRVLENGTIRRVGGTSDIPIDVRIVSATNRAPTEALTTGRLREDLFYRVYVFPIELPPLRERGDDVVLLAEHFAREAATADGHRPSGLSDDARAALLRYPWPGNVRELRNAMTRASLIAHGETIRLEHLPPTLATDALAVGAPPAGQGARPAGGDDAEVRVALGTSLEAAERLLVDRTLAHFGGHRERTARALGITPKTLFNKCKAYGLGTRSGQGDGL